MTRGLAALALLLAAPPAFAQRTELALLAGYTSAGSIDKTAAGVESLEAGGGFTWGLQAGHFFTPHLGAEVSWARQESSLQISTSAGSAELFDMAVGQLHGDVVYRFGAEGARLKPLLFAGLGATFFSASDLDGETKLSWSLGAGLDWFPKKSLGARLQALYNPTQLNDESSDSCDPFGFCQGSLQQFEVMGGVVFRFSGKGSEVMRRGITLGFVGAAALGLAACASTRFNSTWKAPDAGPLNFKGLKIAALVISPNESTRLGAEGVLARELTARGVQGIPAYNLLPPNESRDKEKAKTLFNAAGVAGVVVMRAAGKQQELTSTPGYWSAPYYGSFWGGGGYYGYGWGAVYEPGYLRTDTIVNVETLVYDLRSDKLVWAGMSESTNPEHVEGLIKELVAAAAGEMKKQGLIRSK